MIPIFIVTCDRLTMLQESIQSYHDTIDTPFIIVMLDQGSSYGPTVEYLRMLESAGTKVYRWSSPNTGKRRNAKRNDLMVTQSIKDYFTTHGSSNYVVTDPDIALDPADGNILAVYSTLLGKMTNVAVVGPMLRIDDIPGYYPEKEILLSGKKGLHYKFHRSAIRTINLGHDPIRYIKAPIDTTFGMYRSGTEWRRLQHGIRTLAPYTAKHLDWYVDPDNVSPDQAYYMEHASNNNHWSRWNG